VIVAARGPVDLLVVELLEARLFLAPTCLPVVHLLQHRCRHCAGDQEGGPAQGNQGAVGVSTKGHAPHPTWRSLMNSASSASSGAMEVNSVNRSRVWVIASIARRESWALDLPA